MADLATIAAVDSELALTADYDVVNDVAKARRRVAALRRKLDFPETLGREQETVTLAMQTIERQLNEAKQWIAANTDPTPEQRNRNPDVIHADFSTFRGYRS